MNVNSPLGVFLSIFSTGQSYTTRRIVILNLCYNSSMAKVYIDFITQKNDYIFNKTVI